MLGGGQGGEGLAAILLCPGCGLLGACARSLLSAFKIVGTLLLGTGDGLRGARWTDGAAGRWDQLEIYTGRRSTCILCLIGASDLGPDTA